MKALAAALVDAMAFLELADEATVNEDDAVRVLEDLAATLRDCSAAETTALREVLADRAKRSTGKRRRFYVDFFSACGLEEGDGRASPEPVPVKAGKVGGGRGAKGRAVRVGKERTPKAVRELIRLLEPEGGDAAAVEAVLSRHPTAVNADLGNRDRPLHRAALYGHTAAVRLLLARGAKVDARNVHGETPLHQAALNGNRPATALLLAAGAEVNAANRRRETPLAVALDYGAGRAVANLLRRHGGRR